MEYNYEIYPPLKGEREPIERFIVKSDKWFIPPLSQRTDIRAYASKLYDKGFKFVCLKEGGIIGLCVAYINKAPDYSFGSYTVVDPRFDGMGLGLIVTRNAINYAKEIGSAGFKLKMRAENKMLLKFYQKMGFEIANESYYTNTDIKELELIKKF